MHQKRGNSYGRGFFDFELKDVDEGNERNQQCWDIGNPISYLKFLEEYKYVGYSKNHSRNKY